MDQLPARADPRLGRRRHEGRFPHYAYHGYYTRDWSKLDANMGTEADLRRLVDEAHARNTYSVRRGDEPCRLRHLADMQEFQFGSLYLQGDELKNSRRALDGLEAGRGTDLAQL